MGQPGVTASPGLYVAIGEAAAADLARSQAKLVLPVDNGDGLVGPEGAVTPPAASVRRSKSGVEDYALRNKQNPPERINNGPTVRLRFAVGDQEYAATCRVDEYDRPAGKITLRGKGRILLETDKHFGTLADILQYCMDFLTNLGPKPVYPGGTDAEAQVGNLQDADPEALSYPAKHTKTPEILVRV